MGAQDSGLGRPEIERKTTHQEKKPYRFPRLMVYGNLRQLTMGTQGPAKDGGAGSPNSKPSGGA